MSQEARLLPSDVEDYESDADILVNEQCEAGATIQNLCAEVRACWSEIESLRAIALTAAELVVTYPNLAGESLCNAVSEWQKKEREKA